MPPSSPPLTIVETPRQAAQMPGYEVVVCGAGPAGVAAAVSAARVGARTCLLELQGCLGGVWTSGLLGFVLDAKGKEGFLLELLQRLEAASGEEARYFFLAGVGKTPDFFFDPEDMKVVLEDMCLEAGVSIQLHTHVVNAVVQQGAVEAVITESKSGRQAWPGTIFIDASGDGDLAALAGCRYDYGRPQADGSVAAQPMSFCALVTGIDADLAAPFINGHPAFSKPGFNDLQTKHALAAEIRRAGAPLSYDTPVLFYIRPGTFAFCANHEYGLCGLDAAHISQASFHARAELHQQVRALRKLGGVWQDLSIISTPSYIGVREGRRIHGRYTVTSEDLRLGQKHSDAVCRVNFPVDIHSPDPRQGKAYSTEGVHSQAYDIPLRALMARDVERLLLAGRCISGDFLAHASYRVSGNATSLGQAAGVTAALACKQGLNLQDVPYSEVKDVLKSIYLSQ